MNNQIEELRAAYDAASDDLAAATVAYNAAYRAAEAANTAYDAAIDAADANRLWREAKAALEAAEKDIKND